MAIYMKIPDIPGEATAQDYRDMIRVLDMQWGLARPGAPNSRAVFSDVTITKALDRATPLLAKRVANGNSMGKTRIFNVLEGEVPREIEKITMWKTRATALNETDNESAGPPIDVVSFSFNKIAVVHRLFDELGQLRGTTRFAWDLVNDQPFSADEPAAAPA